MTGFILKLIAIITMFTDHFTKTILVPSGISGQPFIELAGHTVTNGMILVMIGRMAFPLFAFLVAQGARHTSDIKRYIFRIMLFALISEIPYNLCFHSSTSFLFDQNVMFSFALSLCTIWLCEKANDNALAIPISITAMAAAKLLNVDYGSYGVFLVIVFYYARKNSISIPLFLAASLAHYCNAYLSNIPALTMQFLGTAAAAIPMLLYNGKRGKSFKWAFYAFYPAHIIILFLIKHFMFT